MQMKLVSSKRRFVIGGQVLENCHNIKNMCICMKVCVHACMAPRLCICVLKIHFHQSSMSSVFSCLRLCLKDTVTSQQHACCNLVVTWEWHQVQCFIMHASISVYACAFYVIHVLWTIISSINCFCHVRAAEQTVNTILPYYHNSPFCTVLGSTNCCRKYLALCLPCDLLCSPANH